MLNCNAVRPCSCATIWHSRTSPIPIPIPIPNRCAPCPLCEPLNSNKNSPMKTTVLNSELSIIIINCSLFRSVLTVEQATSRTRHQLAHEAIFLYFWPHIFKLVTARLAKCNSSHCRGQSLVHTSRSGPKNARGSAFRCKCSTVQYNILARVDVPCASNFFMMSSVGRKHSV